MELSFALITSFPEIPIKPADCRAVTAELRTLRLYISATPQEHLPLPNLTDGFEEHFDLQELTLVFVLLEVFSACSLLLDVLETAIMSIGPGLVDWVLSTSCLAPDGATLLILVWLELGNSLVDLQYIRGIQIMLVPREALLQD
jgi:hypothetical protein